MHMQALNKLRGDKKIQIPETFFSFEYISPNFKMVVSLSFIADSPLLSLTVSFTKREKYKH